MSYLPIPYGGDGSATYPFILASAPDAGAGFAANVHSIAKDQSTGIYYQKTGTGDTEWTPITGSTAYETDEDYYKARASMLMGSPRLTCWYWDDFLEPSTENWTASVASGGTWTTKADPCGVTALTCPSGASSSANIALGGTFTASKNFIPGGSSGVWYIAIRMKVTGADANGQSAYVELDDLDVGDFGFAGEERWAMWSATSGGAQYSATTNDQGTHLHEWVRVGGTTTYYLDEVAIKAGAPYYPSNNAQPFIKAASAAAAAVGRVVNVDFFAGAVGGNNPRTIS